MIIFDELLEPILKSVLEVILLNLVYATGFIILLVGSLGQLDIAPLSTHNRDLAKMKKKDISLFKRNFFWIYGPRKRRMLHAHYPIFLGFITWVGAVVLKVIL